MTHLFSLRFYFADKVSKYDNVPYAQLCERYDFSYYINENKMHLQKKTKTKKYKKKKPTGWQVVIVWMFSIGKNDATNHNLNRYKLI